MAREGWRGVGEGLWRGWVGEGLGRAWISILQNPVCKIPLTFPGVHCQTLFTEFRSECHRMCERQDVFGNGPEKISNEFAWNTIGPSTQLIPQEFSGVTEVKYYAR